MNSHTHIFFLVLSLVFSITSYAQKPIYKHFGVDEGLPSSEVYDIYQDKEGYIWFATDKGLSRYNGYEFENFDISNGLPGNVVLRFYPQTNGEVWCYSLYYKALFYFNETFDGFRTYKHNNILSKMLGKSSIVKSVYIDEFKTVHLGGININGKLLIEENGKVKKNHHLERSLTKKSIVLTAPSKDVEFCFTTTDKNIIKSNFSKIKHGGRMQALWLVRNKRAVIMDGNSIEIISSNKVIKTIESQFIPLGIRVIDSTHFFTGYYYGGSKIINDKGEIIQEYLKGKSVTNFLIDHEGGYWFTTHNSGVYYIKNPSIVTFKQPENSTSFHINSLVKKNNDLLIGYKNGDFAEIGANRAFNFKNKASISIPSIVEYDSIFDKTYIYHDNKVEVNKEVSTPRYTIKLSEPSLNGTVFASNSHGYTVLNDSKYTSFPYRVQDVSVWKKDTLIATPFGVFKKLKDSIIVLSKESELLGYRSDDIDVSTSDDCFFIATQSAGVVVYGKNIYNISTKNGLTSNIVNEIYVENDATIWACTNKGLNRIMFNDNGFSVTSIDKNAGLLSNEVEDVEIINDTLWVGTKNGLCYMPKKVLDNKQLDNIYLKLKEVKANGVIYSNNETPKLNYDENKISFFVQGISYAKNNDIQYRYRLKEVDSVWSVTKNRNISFPNLKHGKYTFQVKVCIDRKCYNQKKIEYSFLIRPPFWKTGWFYTLCIFLFGGVLYVFFKIRVLTYNKDVIRELVRLLIKRLKRDEKYIEIRMNGERIKISTNEILYIKSSGNYLDIVSSDKTYTIRCKIGVFITTTPDALEYLRVHRSYIIRIDKITGKSKNSVTINEHIIPVGETYLKQLDKIQF